ncbi:MAG: TatD family hydrolase [Thiohalocapsa sp.]|jgi:TatD DNase family protein
MRLIDTHCHLDVAAFDADRDRVIADARAAGVTRIVVPAIDAAGWASLLALCAAERGLYPALGLHPLFIDRHRDADLDALERALGDHHPIAVGEIGLDFHDRSADRDRQRRLCTVQLALARDAGLPVLLHVRKAHEDMLRMLREAGVRGGVAHAFNGSLQQAERYIDLGFKLGLGGMLTFERSTRLRRLARALPVESIVLETDAPDLTVASHRFERNSPAYLPEVLAALAEVRGADPAVVARQTTANAEALLGIGDAERQ